MHGHMFDISIASEFGVEEAILIGHFQYWIRINKRNERNFIEGSTWTYQTRKEILSHFPYWNYERVKYLTERLVALQVLKTGNFNKSPIDKTLWYAFLDEKRFGLDDESLKNLYEGQNSLSYKDFENKGNIPKNSRNLYDRENSLSIGKIPHPIGKIPSPIPDTIPNTKTPYIPPPPILESSTPPSQPLCKNGGGGEKKEDSSDLIYKNTRGEIKKASQSDIFNHFVKLPFPTAIVQQAIAEARYTQDYIGNIMRYIEAICFRLTNQQPEAKPVEKKKKECNIPDVSKAPRVSIGENLIKILMERENASKQCPGST